VEARVSSFLQRIDHGSREPGADGLTVSTCFVQDFSYSSYHQIRFFQVHLMATFCIKQLIQNGAEPNTGGGPGIECFSTLLEPLTLPRGGVSDCRIAAWQAMIAG
jgi:hypothetical protein